MTFSADFKTIESGRQQIQNDFSLTISDQKFGRNGMIFNLLEDQVYYYRINGDCINEDGSKLEFYSYDRSYATTIDNVGACKTACDKNKYCTAYIWDYACKIITETCKMKADLFIGYYCNVKINDITKNTNQQWPLCDKLKTYKGNCKRSDAVALPGTVQTGKNTLEKCKYACDYQNKVSTGSCGAYDFGGLTPICNTYNSGLYKVTGTPGPTITGLTCYEIAKVTVNAEASPNNGVCIYKHAKGEVFEKYATKHSTLTSLETCKSQCETDYLLCKAYQFGEVTNKCVTFEKDWRKDLIVARGINHLPKCYSAGLTTPAQTVD